MSTKTREVIWGGRAMGAKMRAETARQEARKAARAADRAEAEAWSVRMEGYGAPGAAVSNVRPMLERRLRLAGDRVLPLQDKGKLAVRCYPPGA
jgi:hypothetical protein